MTRKIFTVLFMVVAFVFLYTMAHFEKLDIVATFSFIIVVAAYSAGQYSTKFPKEKK
jgi:hypothetical protein